MNRVSKHDGEFPDWGKEPAIERRWICTVSGKSMNATCKGIGAPFVPGTAPKGSCPVEHPPPEPPVEGEETKPAHESLWKRLERERLEKEAAALTPEE